MNKYETGSYLLILFDKHGSKLTEVKPESFSLAEKLGEEAIMHPPNASYVITRTLKNSVDTAWPWNTIPEEHE